jgi:PAS domain S-box-containing protein
MNKIFLKSHDLLLGTRAYLLRLLFITIALNIFVYGLTALFLYKSRLQYENQIAIQTQNLSQSLSQTLKNVVDKTDICLLHLKNEMERQIKSGMIDKEFISDTLITEFRNIPELDGMRITNARGDVVYRDRPDPPGAPVYNIADREHFMYARDHKDAGLIFSKPVFGRHSHKWQVNIDRRINNPDGSFAGIVFASISLEYVTRLFATFDIGKNGVLTFRQDDMTILVRYPDDPMKSSFGTKTISRQLAAQLQAGKTSGTYINPGSVDSVERIFAFNKIPSYPLYITHGRATNDLLAPWRNDASKTLMLVSLFTSATIIAAVMLYRNRKRIAAAESMTEERNYLHTLFEHNGSGHLVASSSRKILQANQYFCELFGYTEDELIGRSTEMLHIDRRHFEEFEPFYEQAKGGKTRTSIEYPWQRKDGTTFWCIFTGVTLFLPTDEYGIVWSVIDITHRKQAEEELHRTAFILENMPDAVYWTGFEGNYFYVNKAACEMLGYSKEELLSKTVSETDPNYPIDRWPVHMEQLRREGCLRFETVHMTKGGRTIPVDVTVYYYHYHGAEYSCAIAHDISKIKEEAEERKQLESKLMQAQKLESIGRLAGGVAHDFNNLLTPIIGYADLEKNAMLAEHRNTMRIDNIIKAADKARILTQQLLGFGRKQVLEMKIIDLNDVVSSFYEILRRTVRENIDIRMILAADPPGIKADKNQIEQIIMNLVVNAQDAIDANGVITIETAPICLDEEYSRQHAGVTPGNYLMFVVTDNGCGMDEDSLSKIFEPFFTTKGVGEGSGLGLATVYGLVKQHDGHIGVYSEKGKGSAFKLYFPIVEDQPLSETKQISESHTLEASGRNVLLVEDNEMVRDLANDLLVSLGFSVILAEGPKQAISLSKDRHIDLLVSDVVMPDMNGPELHEKILKIHPNIKVLFMSGYTNNFITHHGILDEGINFIQKPFAANDLARKIEAVLNA